MSMKTALRTEWVTPGLWKQFIGASIVCGVLGGTGSLFVDTLETQPVPAIIANFRYLHLDTELQTILVDLWQLVEARVVSEKRIVHLLKVHDELVFVQQSALQQKDVLVADLTLGARAYELGLDAKSIISLMGEEPPTSRSARDDFQQLLQDIYEAIEAIVKDTSTSLLNMLHCLQPC